LQCYSMMHFRVCYFTTPTCRLPPITNALVATPRPCGCCGGAQAAERKAAEAEASVAGLAGSLQQRLAGLAAEVAGLGRRTLACMPGVACWA